jgi:hypothetical protein
LRLRKSVWLLLHYLIHALLPTGFNIQAQLFYKVLQTLLHLAQVSQTLSLYLANMYVLSGLHSALNLT